MDKFFCDICENPFKSLRTLTFHKKSHAPDFKISCPTCKKVFRKSYLNKHMVNCFTAEEPQTEFKCDFCRKKYTQLKNLNRHMRIHDSMFVSEACQLCPKTFSRQYALQEHVKNIHELVVGEETTLVESKKGKPWCEICNKPFSKRSNMMRHIEDMHKGYDEKNKERLVFGPNIFLVEKTKTQVSDAEDFAKNYVDGLLNH